MFADAIVLSHKEDLDRLATSTPAAAERAVVAGDPCFDRMRTSLHRRAAFRAALGAEKSDTVVLVSSTWGRNSLFGRHPDLISQLLGELTMDDHVVAAVLHGNVWAGHGRAQLRGWLGDALRSGLRLVPPLRGWQQAVLAADVVVGDHGAVTGYGAASGIPTVLATFPVEEVAPGSAIDALGRRAMVLDHDRPFEAQLHDAIDVHDPARYAAVSDLASSVPDRTADHLRTMFYRLMGLAEPEHPALVVPYRATDLRPEVEQPRAMYAVADPGDDGVVDIRRWPADVTVRRGTGPRAAEPHLVVHRGHPRRDLCGNAAVVLVDEVERDGPEVFRTSAVCRLIASAEPSGLRVRLRDGTELLLRSTTPAADPTVFASAVHRWPTGTIPTDIVVRVGYRRLHAAVEVRAVGSTRTELLE